MALIRAIGVGGGTNSITPDTSKLLGSITTAGGSFTAPQDCIMMGWCVGGGTWARIIIGNDDTNGNWVLMTNGTTRIGVNENNWNNLQNYGVLIPKGTLVKTRNYQTYNLRFYAISTS